MTGIILNEVKLNFIVDFLFKSVKLVVILYLNIIYLIFKIILYFKYLREKIHWVDRKNNLNI